MPNDQRYRRFFCLPLLLVLLAGCASEQAKWNAVHQAKARESAAWNELEACRQRSQAQADRVESARYWKYECADARARWLNANGAQWSALGDAHPGADPGIVLIQPIVPALPAR